MCKKDNPNNKRLLATSVLQDCGVSDKFKILAYLCGQCITEVKGLFSPQPRKAPNVVSNAKKSYSKEISFNSNQNFVTCVKLIKNLK